MVDPDNKMTNPIIDIKAKGQHLIFMEMKNRATLIIRVKMSMYPKAKLILLTPIKKAGDYSPT